VTNIKRDLGYKNTSKSKKIKKSSYKRNTDIPCFHSMNLIGIKMKKAWPARLESATRSHVSHEPSFSLSPAEFRIWPGAKPLCWQINHENKALIRGLSISGALAPYHRIYEVRLPHPWESTRDIGYMTGGRGWDATTSHASLTPRAGPS